jgi:hypothetical protein
VLRPELLQCHDHGLKIEWCRHKELLLRQSRDFLRDALL